VRGVIALLAFLFLSTALVSAVAARNNSSQSLEKAITDSMTRRRLFYSARAEEDLFWSVLLKAVAECKSCDRSTLETRLYAAVKDWAADNDAGSGWVDIDGSVHAGPAAVADFVKTLPCLVFISKQYEVPTRDVIYVPFHEDSFRTYALIASGEGLEIPC